MYTFLSSFSEDIVEPSFSFEELLSLFRKNPVHESTIQFLVSILSSSARFDEDFLSREDFEAFLFDFLVLGNAFFLGLTNYFSKTAMLKRIPAAKTRILRNRNFLCLLEDTELKIAKHNIIHLKEYAIDCEPYGAPAYLSAKKDIELIDEILSLRTRFCKNNANLGGILVFSGNEEDKKQTQKEIQKTQKEKAGSMLICVVGPEKNPKDAIHFIEQTKSFETTEHSNMLRDSRDHIHIAHRVPQEFLAAFSNKKRDENNAWKIFCKTKIEPMQRKIARTINKAVGTEKIRFENFLDVLEGN